MQDPKEKFVSQKGCTKKVLEHLSLSKSIRAQTINKFRNYALDSREVLYKMLRS